MNNLSLIKFQNFGSVKCDFYRNESNDILMTREQIGQALGYEDPKDAIAKIHRRHKERLDKFSGVDKVSTPGGMQNVVYYSMKGVYEIYRWSRQLKADEFIDFCWSVMEEIRKGSFKVEPVQLQCIKETNRAMKFIHDENVKDNIARQIIAKLYGIEVKPLDVESVAVDDSVREFVKERCTISTNAEIRVSLIYSVYQRFCIANDTSLLTEIKFGKNLRLLGFKQRRTPGVRLWDGIAIKQ